MPWSEPSMTAWTWRRRLVYGDAQDRDPHHDHDTQAPFTRSRSGRRRPAGEGSVGAGWISRFLVYCGIRIQLRLADESPALATRHEVDDDPLEDRRQPAGHVHQRRSMNASAARKRLQRGRQTRIGVRASPSARRFRSGALGQQVGEVDHERDSSARVHSAFARGARRVSTMAQKQPARQAQITTGVPNRVPTPRPSANALGGRSARPSGLQPGPRRRSAHGRAGLEQLARQPVHTARREPA